ncbi:thiopurine S-methyltransferase-like [Panulirus ornatus]|uniref:thiopurine S-methyltransferase-like n=1 Tax=Panulirus ornatus TaxID=150431 RepID=UPI003A88507B
MPIADDLWDKAGSPTPVPFSSPPTAMSVAGRIETWTQKWATGRTLWHKNDVNYALLHHETLLLRSPGLRVFVPLCGKSVDLKWFYDKGHTVVGVEGVEQAAVEFFSEHSLNYKTEQLTWAKLYKTNDDRLNIYCCDMFKVDIATLGKFDVVWDRGSLVAIYEEDRKSYVSILKSLLASDFRYLLSVTQYTPNENFSGPPRNIPTELIEELFGEICKLKILEKFYWTEEDELIARWSLKSMDETIVLLTPKNSP